MTDVYSDSHIICCFEDVQHHLEEMGVHSTLRSGQLIFCYDDDKEWTFSRFDGLAYYLPFHTNHRVRKLYKGHKAIRDLAQFLWEFNKYYLDALERVENAT